MEKKVEPMQANDQQPATDDQELAKVLQGVSQQAQDLSTDQSGQNGQAAAPSGLQFEETPAPAQQAQPATEAAAPNLPTPADAPAETPAAPAAPDASQQAPATQPNDPNNPGQAVSPSDLPPELANIKKDALDELRPLIPKLNLPPEDKFNTILLVIRSTDDQSLVGAAHDAAKAIEDEAKRAQALLDIVREIDYFANQGK